MDNKDIKLVSNDVAKLSDIKAEPISRAKTFFDNLDITYGFSDFPNNEVRWGMPKGKVSLWAGEKGVGKSRLAIQVAKNFSSFYTNGTVLYFQTEAPLSDFASWAVDGKEYNKIYCSGVNNIDRMIEIIYEIKPLLVIIDSVNEIEEFENGTKQESKRLMQGRDGSIGFRQAIVDNDIYHIILLGQLNQDGKTIKGGTSLPHLVDIELVLKSNKDLYPSLSDVFTVNVGSKHRYGSKENWTSFKHVEDGVMELCVNYLNNKKFCDSMGYSELMEQESVSSGPHRVPANTKSGFVSVDKNGWVDPTDPEFQEHLNSVRARNNVQKSQGQGWYDKVGQFLENL